jgi:hypothetical protein
MAAFGLRGRFHQERRAIDDIAIDVAVVTQIRVVTQF